MKSESQANLELQPLPKGSRGGDRWMEPSASTLLRTQAPRSLWGRLLRVIYNWL